MTNTSLPRRGAAGIPSAFARLISKFRQWLIHRWRRHVDVHGMPEHLFKDADFKPQRLSETSLASRWQQELADIARNRTDRD